MRVRYLRGASADIEGILDYVGERNPKAAADLSRRFGEADRLLGEFPDVGIPTQRKRFRKLIVDQFLMVYEVKADEVTVYYVRHGARQLPKEFGK